MRAGWHVLLTHISLFFSVFRSHYITSCVVENRKQRRGVVCGLAGVKAGEGGVAVAAEVVAVIIGAALITP